MALITTAFPKDIIHPSMDAGFELRENISSFDNGKWHPNWDEAEVFNVELRREDYRLRIGKGGQLYSIETPIGEIMPPQGEEHAWVDDMWLLTTNQSDLHLRDGDSEPFMAFVHQCGMYMFKDPEAFKTRKYCWSPLLGEDRSDHSYSTLNLGCISTTPAYNRGDMLMYQKTRDIGDGAFEVTYMAYNYNSSFDPSKNFMTSFSPWGGVRTSKLPDHILSKPDQSWELRNEMFNVHTAVCETGGWAVNTEDHTNDKSYSIGLVFGRDCPSETEGKGYCWGKTEQHDGHRIRDFKVQAIGFNQPFPPGRLYFCRMIFVLGELKDVIERCKDLAGYPDAGFLDHEQASGTRVPLYLDKRDGQTILTEQRPESNGKAMPACCVFAEPVKNSKPLYLIRNNIEGKLHATCDPYMVMPRYPIDGDQDRTGYKVYDGSTDILKLYGFVMEKKTCDPSLDYLPLRSILRDKSFYPEMGLYDNEIVVLRGAGDAFETKQ